MALQGTLDTFALPDVLRLLGSTNKRGRLRVNGDRGSGSVWVDDGQIVATESVGPATGEPTTVDTVFGMLRFKSGSFTFENGGTTSAAGTPESVDTVLSQSELLLAEWLTIEEAVPSLSSWATLRPELDSNDIVVDADRWRAIVAIGSGATIATVGEKLDLGELPASRAVKELVDLRLVLVGDAPDSLPAPPPPATSDLPAPPPLDVTDGYDFTVPDAPPSDLDVDHDHAGIPAMDERPVAEAPHDLAWDSDPLPQMDRRRVGLDSLATDGFGGSDDEDLGDPEVTDDEVDAAEMARQLANLSPKAAKAVAAAAKATSESEREAALAAVEAEGEAVDRGMLLKFLGSVDG